MDIGISLALGIVIGITFGISIAAIIGAVRKVRSSGHATPAQTGAAPVGPYRAPQNKTTVIRLTDTGMIERSKTRGRAETGVVELLTTREAQLGKSVFEVRELVRNLGAAIAKTNAASLAATEVFDSAQTNLQEMRADDGDGLLSLHSMLLEEVSRVQTTNQSLRTELADAKKGIEEQRRQIEELKNAVRIDALTKLPNRAAFDERIREFCQRLERTGELFTLLMLDIDNFKSVNDTYGHLNGDRVLRGVALKIRESIRGNDMPARLGGEEFAVLLPDTPLREAALVAERVRNDLAKTVFKLDESRVRVTISGGLAESWKGMGCPDELISRSDKALYEAKSNGRNRMVLFEANGTRKAEE
ncbi:MAG: GGDEF domain-containing protein [Planctomycetota bacterium]|jgi:diguanylate cyclase|nr:GGDEF domain-containing protein [Planctomycetota bacterium]